MANNSNNTNGNNTMKTLGIIIMVVGLAIALYTGLDSKESVQVADTSSVQLTSDNENNVDWGPYAGIGLIVIGGVVYFAGRKEVVTDDRNSDNKNLRTRNSDKKNLQI